LCIYSNFFFNFKFFFNQNISEVFFISHFLNIILLFSNKHFSFLHSGSNDIANIENNLNAISVPKHLVLERFQIKRIFKDNQNKYFLDGEDENNLSFQNKHIQTGNKAILGVRRNGELIYYDLSPAERTLLRDLG
jgi:hypothetical protein